MKNLLTGATGRYDARIPGLVEASLVCLGLAVPVAAEPVKFSLRHINDIDRIEDSKGRGGLARLMTLVNRERAAAEHAIFTHGGDTISPSLQIGRAHV